MTIYIKSNKEGFKYLSERYIGSNCLFGTINNQEFTKFDLELYQSKILENDLILNNISNLILTNNQIIEEFFNNDKLTIQITNKIDFIIKNSNFPIKKKVVVIGISGGVDSSVAAYLLKEQGYNVVGLFMRNWDSLANNDILGNNDLGNICPQEQDFLDAVSVCETLNIPIYRVDFIKEYWDNVFTDLIEQYKKGRTPNPDILCNKYIKFDHFAKYAFDVLKADYLAMGHYAKVENSQLFRASDKNKDQSYFLSQLSNQQLAKVIMPLANIEKPQIREIALKLNLITAQKKDSTGICFVGERNFTQFLQNYIPSQPGNIISVVTNEVVGQHVGAMYYTLGQRKGLNLGGQKEKHYVCGHDIQNKIVYVAPISRMEFLLSSSLEAIEFNQIAKEFNYNNLTAKFRYRQKDIPITLKILQEGKIKVHYPQEVAAVTPGQQIVIYDNDKVVGGAIIDKVFK
ncbi:tRNA 2-thiouridine(34) synthase MnmA [Mycoplasma phocimorsus]|uniref:tRNA 2-thiouridine(34) synthase MnmA n=1 Tax=Mycoplasma phocimorsus TaxID=3045839 RepID=UPI0032201CD5